MRKMKWAYGVTTVLERRKDLLPRTLKSLQGAGFSEPRLFIDGVDSHQDFFWYQSTFSLEVTIRSPKIRSYGNWVLALAELYIREPYADRYAIFQDDFVTYSNLREYLEQCPYPTKGYLNLYTFGPPKQEPPPFVGLTGRLRVGWFLSNQMGRGAVALVFDRDAVMTLLTHQPQIKPGGNLDGSETVDNKQCLKHLVERPLDAQRGHRSIDGGIVTALKKAGYKEWVHHPSLTQHLGNYSTMGSKPHPRAKTFIGENFDARELLILAKDN